MSKAKQDRYANLVAEVNDYLQTEGGYPELDGELFDLQEVNLWTYWQGRGGGLSPKLLVVGQDWGSIDDSKNRFLIENAIRMNKGSGTGLDGVQCFDGIEVSPFPTDNNLRFIFQETMGADFDLFERRYNQLFFTNVVLRYRRGKSSGGHMCATARERELFAELVDILRPRAIVCLGASAFKDVLRAGGAAVSRSSFNEMIDSGAVPASFGEHDYSVFPVAHTGSFGTMNRWRYLEKNGYGPFAEPRCVHVEDWRKVIEGAGLSFGEGCRG